MYWMARALRVGITFLYDGVLNGEILKSSLIADPTH